LALFRRQTAAPGEEEPAAFARLKRGPFVGRVGQPEKLADAGIGQKPCVTRRCRPQDTSQFQTAMTAHHRAIPAPASERTDGTKAAKVAPQAVTQKVFEDVHGTKFIATQSRPRNSRR